jgi:hypothetical protein
MPTYADGQPIPCCGFIKKTVQFQGKLLTSSFLQAAVAGPILGIDFLRKFKVTVVPDINQIQFACTAAALPTLFLPSAASPTPFLPSAALPTPFSVPAASSALPCLFSFPPVPAPVPIQLPTATTSSQPPAISAHVVWNPKVKCYSFSSMENQSLLDPPHSLQKIPDSLPADVKALLQQFPAIFAHRGCEADTNPWG